MLSVELRDYIKNELARGIGQSDIKQSLVEDGWSVEQIDEVFKQIINPPATPPLSSVRILSSSGGHFDAVKIFKQSSGFIKRWWLRAIVCLGLLLAAGGAWAYYYYYWTAPTRVLVRSYEKWGEIKSSQINIELNLALKFAQDNKVPQSLMPLLSSEMVNLAIKMDVVSDINNQDSITSDSKLWLEIKESDPKISIGIEYLQKDKVGYARLIEAPNLGIVDLSAFKGQWVKFSLTDLDKGLSLPVNIPVYNYQNFNQAKISKLQEIIFNTKPIKFNRRFGGDKVNGVKSYHYGFTIDPLALVKFITQASLVIKDSELTGEELKNIESLKGGLAELTQQFNGEIWIGKKDYWVRQLKLTLPDSGKAENIFRGGSLVVKVERINEPVKIEAPAEAFDLKQILDGFMNEIPAGFSSDNVSVLDQDSDQDGLSDVLEDNIGTDKNNPDTDNDGYKDGEELNNGYNPLGAGRLSELGLPKDNIGNFLGPDETQ